MRKRANICAVLAAALYALSTPCSKLLLHEVPPTMLAALLYLGAGFGMAVMGLFNRTSGEERLTRAERKYIVGMVLLDIAAPILLMCGLRWTTAANASLLNNFEIVATALTGFYLFHEKINRRTWTAIGWITAACCILSLPQAGSLSFSAGSLLVLLACVCWGFENNCTSRMASKNPQQIVLIKGIFSGLGSLAIAFAVGERLPSLRYIVTAVVLGFVAYGLSIYFYVYAQRVLGAARTSAYYAVAPFLGAFFSFLFVRETPSAAFFGALLPMAIGTVLVTRL